MLAVVHMVAYDKPIMSATNAYALRGALPWSDAFDYWSAAQHLLQHGVLDEWGSRRPLNGAFLAARLALASDVLWLTLLMQSLALGVAMAELVVVVARRMGVLAALVSAVLLVAVGALVQPTLQSEGLGLLFGTAALALLLRSARVSNASAPTASAPTTSAGEMKSSMGERGLVAGALGVAMLSIAMAVRPGAIFVLPALALWLFWRHRARWVRALIVIILALLAGTAADRTARALYAAPTAAGNANFATTVLGLARGTNYYEADRWLRDTHPSELREAVLANEAYAESWRLVRTAPSTMAATLVRNEWHFIVRVWPLLLCALVGLWRAPRAERAFWALGWIGVLASVPVIYGDGGIRVLAVTWPFAIVAAASALRRRGALLAAASDCAEVAVDRSDVARVRTDNSVDSVDMTSDRVEGIGAWASALVGASAVIFALAGPALAQRFMPSGFMPRPNELLGDPVLRGGADEVDWVRGMPALNAILVWRPDEGEVRSEFPLAASLHHLSLDELMRDPAVIEFGEPFDRLPTPFLLCVVYDLNQSRARVFTLPMNAMTDRALRDDSAGVGVETGTGTGSTAAGGAGASKGPNATPSRGLRIDSRPLRPGGRVRVGVEVASEP